MPSLGFGELVLILVIALVIFGPGKLPGVGRAVGGAMREFRAAKDGIMKDLDPNTATENKKDGKKEKAAEAKVEAKVNESA